MTHRQWLAIPGLQAPKGAWVPVIETMKQCETYKFCGLVIESNTPLPELPRADGGSAECVFYLAPQQKTGRAANQWFQHHRSPAGRIWLSLGQQGPDYLLRFPNLGDFLVSRDTKLVRCYPFPEVPLHTTRHLFLDQVMPLVLSGRRRLVLGASAVASRKAGVAFLGEPGQGKSTLALSFCKEGFSLVADDALLLQEEGEDLLGVPSYPGLRLWPDAVSALFERSPTVNRVVHYSEKGRLGDNEWPPFCTEPARLTHMYLLASSRKESQREESVTISPLSPQEVFIELTRRAYILDVRDHEMLRHRFDCISRLAIRPLFYRLAYPHNYSFLGAVQDAVLRHLRSGAAPPRSTE